jgi:hypothetical protein
MRIRELSWHERLFGRASEKWRIEIIILASEDEIKALRNLESSTILKTLSENTVRIPPID